MKVPQTQVKRKESVTERGEKGQVTVRKSEKGEISQSDSTTGIRSEK